MQDYTPCIFCGGDRSSVDHETQCDGRQGGLGDRFDAEFYRALPLTKEGFDIYHRENPHIYAKLRQYALEAKHAGRTHLGVKMLYERVRWYTMVEAKDDTFKLNNNWHAFYARLLMEDPELAGLFETRRSVADVEVLT
jgi:hypothetical protein